MDIYSGIIYWFLMLFLQLAPSQELHHPAVYTYLVEPGGRTIVVEVKSAEPQRTEIEAHYGEGEPHPHRAVVEIGPGGRRVLSVMDGPSEMCDAPFYCPKDGLMLSTDPNYKFLAGGDGRYENGLDSVELVEGCHRMKLHFPDYDVSFDRKIVPLVESTPKKEKTSEPTPKDTTSEGS